MPHLIAHNLEANASPMVDVTHYSSPCFDALEDSCLFEDCLSFARKGVAEEPPDSAVQCMEVIRESSVTINRC